MSYERLPVVPSKTEKTFWNGRDIRTAVLGTYDPSKIEPSGELSRLLDLAHSSGLGASAFPGQMTKISLIVEARASSAIEGIVPDIQDVVCDTPAGNPVVANAGMLGRAIREDATLDNIISWASCLPNGELRKTQNWIGTMFSTPETAIYVPPRHRMVVPYLEEMLRHGYYTDIASAAIEHAYFESIHPFNDGNGRTGRALLFKRLSQRYRAAIPISTYLLRHREAYYRALSQYREGDASPIVALVASAVISGVLRTSIAQNELLRMEESVTGREGSIVRSLGAFSRDGQPLTIAFIREKFDCADSTARASISRLVEAGTVVEAGKSKRETVWANPQYWNLVDRGAGVPTMM